ncbi:MAG: PEP-CTERM-box response regulator transcription factor [Candidatus Eisenbacteria sp.]|nr:PEP-CTERM-box response regulator transcription factor [Candidatus Eisenbacteria bacterium]
MSMLTTEGVQMAKLLIVDDDPEILSQLGLALGKEYSVQTADTVEAAWEAIQAEHPDLITLDLALDGSNPETGFSLLERCLAFDPLIKVVLITGNDNQINALRAIEQGAADFFGKPVDIHELRVLLRRVLSLGRLERRNAELLRELGEERRLGSLVGQSSVMRALFKRIERVASVDIAVLILGDSGTGKELVAKEIRRLSSRATKPFVSINCGAIPDNLLESELFGHEKGAFTGAHISRVGRLEMAQGGIVFLDEIGELPVSLQVKLLRFLQEHEIERVGGRSIIDLDVRVIAATSKDLEDEIQKGRFRQDLYYRLAVVNLNLPPLSERGVDILFLAQYFLDRFRNEFDRGRLSFTPKARRALQQYEWPGNVRELEHRVQKGVLMSSGRLIDVADLELDEATEPRRISIREAREEADRNAIQEALRLTGGNISMASKALRISRPSLHVLLNKLHINAQDYKLGKTQETE